MPDAAYVNPSTVVVLDAKYYLNGSLPMDYDITKQFAYMDKAQAYYREKEEIRYRNIMVLPSDSVSGFADLEIIFDRDYPEEKTPIEILYINFTDALDAYIAGTKLSEIPLS